jgi:hypothetical protein
VERARVNKNAARHIGRLSEEMVEADFGAAAGGPSSLAGLKQMLDGSVSHQVTENARRPVLIVVPAHDEH